MQRVKGDDCHSGDDEEETGDGTGSSGTLRVVFELRRLLIRPEREARLNHREPAEQKQGNHVSRRVRALPTIDQNVAIGLVRLVSHYESAKEK